MLSSARKAVKSALRRACGTNELQATIDRLEVLLELYRGDLFAFLCNSSLKMSDPGVVVETEYAVAVDSADHRNPHGTKNDNTRYPRFCYKCEEIFTTPIRFLDLGCSGGGLVLDFLLRGHFAIGLEGSDYSLKHQRAEWRVIPRHLFTCDVTKPFVVRSRSSGEVLKFNVVTAWEVLEHLEEVALPQFFRNLTNHMTDDALFMGSVATSDYRDPITGEPWHLTVRPREWWLKAFDEANLVVTEHPFAVEDFPRQGGGAVSLTFNWGHDAIPGSGFHVVLKRRC